MASEKSETCRLAIIGGGAAGFFAAIQAAKLLTPGERIIILEKGSQVLGKVRISGGGRCNVTHACFDPRQFATHYPRGNKALIGPLHHWDAQKTVEWFEEHGVSLKTEADGRMFPTTDDSQTIVDCLVGEANKLGIEVKTQTTVTTVSHDPIDEYPFTLTLKDILPLRAKQLVIATGGTRSVTAERLLSFSGHKLHSAVPSLFTFNIPEGGFPDLAGIAVADAEVEIPDLNLSNRGPVLITHWGLSGPGILKLSAWGARELNASIYQFKTVVNWIPNEDTETAFTSQRVSNGKRHIIARSPFSQIPRRLWEALVKRSKINRSTTWAQISKKQSASLADSLTRCVFLVNGKSMNKEEFVTCGGIDLDEVHMKTMESRLIPGLYFAGEVLNIDGITGGFNFQNAWTGGYLAGIAIAQSSNAF